MSSHASKASWANSASVTAVHTTAVLYRGCQRLPVQKLKVHLRCEQLQITVWICKVDDVICFAFVIKSPKASSPVDMHPEVVARIPVISCYGFLPRYRVATKGHAKNPRSLKRSRAASIEKFSIPWSLQVAEQDKAAQRLQQVQDKATQSLKDKQKVLSQREREIGELQTQKNQLLKELIFAKGEIDVRGAVEIIARIEEIRMPSTSTKQPRRGVQKVLSWMVEHNDKLKTRIKQTCKTAKLEESRVRGIAEEPVRHSLRASAWYQ